GPGGGCVRDRAAYCGVAADGLSWRVRHGHVGAHVYERAGHAARRAGVRSPRDSAQSAIEGEHPMEGAVFDRSSHPAPTSHPEFYRTPLVYPDVPFHEMLARTAPRVPERPAIYWRDITLTYRELDALVRSAAVGLR